MDINEPVPSVIRNCDFQQFFPFPHFFLPHFFHKMVHAMTSNNNYCSLRESVAYASNPDVKLVYFTEKGLNLLEAFPDIALIEHAMRRGYSWDNIVERLNDEPLLTSAKKRVCIVRTTESELVANHTTQLLARIEALPTSEWSIGRIADMIVQYMVEHRISDFQVSNAICSIVGSKLPPPPPPPAIDHGSNLVGRIAALHGSKITQDACADMIIDYMIEHNITSYEFADQMCEVLVNKGMVNRLVTNIEEDDISMDDSSTVCEDEINDNQSNTSHLSTVSAWLITSFDSVCTSIQELTLDILPIPSNMDWVIMD